MVWEFEAALNFILFQNLMQCLLKYEMEHQSLDMTLIPATPFALGPAPKGWFMATIVAAASANPPAMPAPIGIQLVYLDLSPSMATIHFEKGACHQFSCFYA